MSLGCYGRLGPFHSCAQIETTDVEADSDPQRMGRVFASYETWCRAIRRYKWNRPRRRIYPANPKVGIRAEGPGQLLRVDVTVIRLLNGTRAFLYAVQDNFSRHGVGAPATVDG